MATIKLKGMVEKVKSTIEVPIWVLVLLIPILVTIIISVITITMSQNSMITKLQVESMNNKVDIEMLKTTKVNIETYIRLEKTMDRVETKLDELMNSKHP